MNDPATLDLYNRILLFKNNSFEDELLFSSPDKPRQRILQALAHKLDLECEYMVLTRTLRVSRPLSEHCPHPGTGHVDLLDSFLLESMGGIFGDNSNHIINSQSTTQLDGIQSTILRSDMNSQSQDTMDTVFTNCNEDPLDLQGLDSRSLFSSGWASSQDGPGAFSSRDWSKLEKTMLQDGDIADRPQNVCIQINDPSCHQVPCSPCQKSSGMF